MASSQPDPNPTETEGSLSKLPGSEPTGSTEPSAAAPAEPPRRSSWVAWSVAILFFVLWMLSVGFGLNERGARRAVEDRLVQTQVELLNTQSELASAQEALQTSEMRLTLVGDGLDDAIDDLSELRAVARNEDTTSAPSAEEPAPEAGGEPVPGEVLPDADPLDLRLGEPSPVGELL